MNIENRLTRTTISFVPPNKELVGVAKEPASEDAAVTDSFEDIEDPNKVEVAFSTVTERKSAYQDQG
jgi:hypothetical protein